MIIFTQTGANGSYATLDPIIQKKYNIKKAFTKNNLYEDISILLDTVPDPPKQCEVKIKEPFKKMIRECQIHFRNFFYQFTEYFNKDRNKDSGRLALHNLKAYKKKQPNLYAGFDLVSTISTDYFSIRELKENEIKLTEKLIDLFELYITNWKKIPIYNYEEQIKNNRESINSQIIHDVQKTFQEKNVITAKHVFMDHPLSYLPIYFNVDDPVFPEVSLIAILSLFKCVKNKPSFYYLIPIFKNKLIIEGGYRIISTIDENNFVWESFAPQNIPEKVMELLPKKERIFIKELSFKNDLLGYLGLIHVFIKQSELYKTEGDDYFILLLHNKIINKCNNTLKTIKDLLIDFNIKYINAKDDLQNIFSELNFEEIFRMVDEIIHIEKYEDALTFFNEKTHILESLCEYFGLPDFLQNKM